MSKTNKVQRRKGEEREMTIAEFIALPEAEKNRIVAEIEAQTPEEHMANSRPLNTAERARWKTFKKNAEKKRGGRPKIGKGSQIVSLSVEKDLLDEADAYARRNGLNRSELISKSLRAVILCRLQFSAAGDITGAKVGEGEEASRM
jgi:hypothetical protein